jgi:hypothetical protein
MKTLPLVFTALFYCFSAHFVIAESQKWEIFNLKDTFELPDKTLNPASWLSRAYEIINAPEKHSSFNQVFDAGPASESYSTSQFHSAPDVYSPISFRHELQDRDLCLDFNLGRAGRLPANSKDFQEFLGVDACQNYFQSPEYKNIQFVRKVMQESVYKMTTSKFNHTLSPAR